MMMLLGLGGGISLGTMGVGVGSVGYRIPTLGPGTESLTEGGGGSPNLRWCCSIKAKSFFGFDDASDDEDGDDVDGVGSGMLFLERVVQSSDPSAPNIFLAAWPIHRIMHAITSMANLSPSLICRRAASGFHNGRNGNMDDVSSRFGFGPGLGTIEVAADLEAAPNLIAHDRTSVQLRLDLVIAMARRLLFREVSVRLLAQRLSISVVERREILSFLPFILLGHAIPERCGSTVLAAGSDAPWGARHAGSCDQSSR